MRISHEAIYQSLYIEGRGGLERELVACLRTGRALRKPRARARKQRTGFITDDVTIGARPEEVESRKTPGHWESDLIIGLTRSAIGTLVERTSRYTTLLHLPRLKGHGTAAMVKNGPALSGYGSESVRDALAATLTPLPEHLRRSVTWDRGRELARHAELTAQRVSVSTSVIRTVHGSAGRTRTRMGSCGSISRRVLICRDTSSVNFRRSLMRSTTALERSTVGELQRKCLPNRYTRPHGTVLRRPVESALRPRVAVVNGVSAQWVTLHRPQGAGLVHRPLHERGLLRRRHLPTDDRAGERIDDERRVREAGHHPDVREVRDIERVGPVDPEVPVDQIRRRRRLRHGGADPLRPAGTAPPVDAHEPFDGAAGHLDALTAQVAHIFNEPYSDSGLRRPCSSRST